MLLSTTLDGNICFKSHLGINALTCIILAATIIIKKRIDQDRLTESFYFPPCVSSGISAALNCSENLCSPFSSRATWTQTPRLFSSGAWRSLAGCSLSSITLLFQQSSVLSCPALPSMGKELLRRKWLCCSIIFCVLP